ncbi:HipA family kinase [Paenarthrobacter aromaticivorans]|uniref:HipA family kinase n=1 Tax=Paenarthrobacter aromaticivorans TaxID=2849150 RepID=UPI003A7FB734
MGDHADYSARATWFGLLNAGNYVRPEPEMQVVAVFKVAKDSGCKPFLGLASNGKTYWIKHSHNDHGVQSLMVERVAAAVGLMLQAPLCPVELVHVPGSIARDPLLAGFGVMSGTAHGSESVEDAIEKMELVHTRDDGNRFRQPRFIALWELFAGEDPQWLYSRQDDFQVWSFDHGFWVSGGEMGDWGGDELEQTVNYWSPWMGDVRHMDPATFLDVADSVASLSVEDLLAAVATVPVSWGIPDHDLESLAWWLFSRRRHISDRMKALSGVASLKER